MSVKTLVRRLVPAWLWNRLRLWKLRRGVSRYPVRRVHHLYGNVPLEIQLADVLSEGWYDVDWPEPPEIALLRSHRLKPGARVFDLGAHQGVIALMLANIVGREGSVIAVEASPHNARVALVNRDLNRAESLQVVHAAIADTSGTITINEGLNGQVEDGEGAWGKLEVPALTIDDLAERYGPPDVLFIDVEGFECHALRGAGRTLSRHPRPDCFIEVHVGLGLEKFGGSVEELLESFPEEHYQLHLAGSNADHGEFVPFDSGSEVLKERFFLVATGKTAAPTSVTVNRPHLKDPRRRDPESDIYSNLDNRSATIPPY